MGSRPGQGGDLHPELRIGAILLAAGEGQRMAGVAKPLIRVQGVPLVTRQLAALNRAGVDEVVVVTGYARAAVEKEVRHRAVTLVHNDAYAAGQQRSVRVGLEALVGPCDAVMIVLVDQPLIEAGDLTELIIAFSRRPCGHVVIPVVAGRRGNPVVIDRYAHEAVLASEPHLGCRHLIDRRPELVHAHETTNVHFLTDLDTVDDLRALALRTGWRIELPAEMPIRSPAEAPHSWPTG